MNYESKLETYITFLMAIFLTLAMTGLLIVGVLAARDYFQHHTCQCLPEQVQK